jgi:hypothetical protein
MRYCRPGKLSGFVSLDPEAQTAGDAEITTMKIKHASRFSFLLSSSAKQDLLRSSSKPFYVGYLINMEDPCFTKKMDLIHCRRGRRRPTSTIVGFQPKQIQWKQFLSLISFIFVLLTMAKLTH